MTYGLQRVDAIIRAPAGAAGLSLMALLLALAILGPALWTLDPLAIDLASALQPPSWAHPFGTDQYGRDLFARFVAGARVSLLTGGAAVALGAVAGVIAGLVVGYKGGLIDNALMRLMDTILAFPPLMMAMAIGIALGGGGLLAAILGIAIATVPWYARIVRSRVLEVRESEFVRAARALGANDRFILRRHILPHLLPIAFVQSSLTFGYAILTVAGLSFVGFGAQPPTPEWGIMITEGQQFALSGQWWIPLAPGLGISVAVIAVNLLGDRIRDVLDPGGTD